MMKKCPGKYGLLLPILTLVSVILIGPIPAAALEWSLSTDLGDDNVRGVFALDGENVWAVDADGGIYRFNGTAWALETSIGVGHYGVAAADENSVFTASEGGKVFHYDGTWKEMTDFGLYNNLCVSVSGSTAMVGAWNSGFIYYYDGYDWNRHTNLDWYESVYSIFQKTGSGIWAATYNSQSSPSRSRIYKFENGWIIQTEIAEVELNSITVPEAGQARAGGGINAPATGYIYTPSGPDWREETAIAQGIIESTWGTDAEHIWACGYQGAIYFYDGTSWTLETNTGTNRHLSIHGYSPYRVWAGGSGGEIYFGFATSPTPTATPTAIPTRTPSEPPPPTPVRRGWHYDYNGDGTSDIAVFRPDSGLWAIRSLTRIYFGQSGDEPVPGDYDADGTTDIGIFRASSGLWAARGISRVYFGQSGDRPVPADYNGDGTGNVAVFRPATGLSRSSGRVPASGPCGTSPGSISEPLATVQSRATTAATVPGRWRSSAPTPDYGRSGN